MVATIEVRPVRYSPSVVELTGPQELLDWRRAHVFMVPGYQYMPRYRQGRWDGRWHPGMWLALAGNSYVFRCSRGLAARVLDDLETPWPFAYEAPDVATLAARWPAVARLHDYQVRALTLALTRGWGRIAFATNAGKGAVIALLAAYAQQQGQRVLICCDELSVYDALRGEIATWAGMAPQLLQAGAASPPDASAGAVTLAMIPTLARRVGGQNATPWKEWMAKQEMLLLDEADKATAPTWRRVIHAAVNTLWRLGFSGSFPEHDGYDDLQLTELMGPVLDRVCNAELIDRGVSARPQVELHGYDATAAVYPFPPDWWARSGPSRRLWTYERVVMQNARRHAFVRSLVRPDVPTAVVINRIEHGHQLLGAFAAGEAAFLDGSADEHERLRVLQAFRAGVLRVLIVTKILDRGTNRLGHAADLIFASGEGSSRQTLQRVGRGLRRADGKEFLRLVDVIDRVTPAGANDRIARAAARYLRTAAAKRVQLYADEGFDAVVHP